MEQKHIDIVLKAMAEKIVDLEFELMLKEHDLERKTEEAKIAAEENRVLKMEITRLAEKVAYFECGKGE